MARTLTGRIIQRLVKERKITPAAGDRLQGTTVLTPDFKHTRLVVTTLPKRPLLGPQRALLASQRYFKHRSWKRKNAITEDPGSES